MSDNYEFFGKFYQDIVNEAVAQANTQSRQSQIPEGSDPVPWNPYEPPLQGGRGGAPRAGATREMTPEQRWTQLGLSSIGGYMQWPLPIGADEEDFAELVETYRFGDPERQDIFGQYGAGLDIDSAALYAEQTFHAFDGKTIGEIQQHLASLEYNNPSELANIQRELWEAGYFGTDEPMIWGRMDQKTQTALGYLFNDSALQPGRSINEILRRFSGAGDQLRSLMGGRGDGGGGGARQQAFQRSSADTLSVVIDSVSENLIGRRVSDTEKSEIIGVIQAQEVAQQRAAYQAQLAGGTFEIEAADTIAGAQIMDRFADEYGATQYSQQVNVLRGMLGGV